MYTRHVVLGVMLLGMATVAPVSRGQWKSATAAETEGQGGAQPEPAARQNGAASFYSDSFGGKKTATGETFSQNKLTAASRDLPLGTRVTVINRKNGKSVNVKVNDRGPYVHGRVIDLSKSAARKIGLGAQGVAPVTVEARPSRQESPELKEAIREKAVAQNRARSDETTLALAGEGLRYEFRE